MDEQNNMTVSAKKEAVFSTASSLLMLILCIVTTVQVILSLATNFPSSIFSNILPILMTIGMWITYSASCKKQSKTVGLQLIRIPFIIKFVATIILWVIVAVLSIVAIVGAMGSDSSEGIIVAAGAILLVLSLIVLGFVYFYFRSINGCIKSGIAIVKDKSVNTNVSGKFAAIVLIVYGLLTVLPQIALGGVILSGSPLIEDLLNSIGLAQLTDTILSLLTGNGAMTIVTAVVSLAVSVIEAILIFGYIGRVKKAS